jgi:predicted NBD/HSP70 family sugar kinase
MRTAAYSGGVVIGVDVGGTKVAAGLVGPDSRILARARTQMAANGAASEGRWPGIEGLGSFRRQR